MHRLLVLVSALAGLVAACSKNEGPAPAAPPAAATGTLSGSAGPHANPNSGKVLQVLSGGGYTYAEVEVGSGQRGWIAGSQIAINPGDRVEWGSYSVMRNFSARSLNRTFEEIVFVDRWGPAGAAAVATSPHGPMTPGAAAAPIAVAAPMVPTAPAAGGAGDSGVVRSVTSAGGYSYVEVDRGGSMVWVAAMETRLEPGDRVRWQGGSEMQNFTAKSIGRTFDRIVFASSLSVAP